MKTILSLGFALAALLVGACGNREPLRPKAGEAMPIAPVAAVRAPTTEELLTRPQEAAPKRVDETLTKSEEREDDRFDLPPTR